MNGDQPAFPNDAVMTTTENADGMSLRAFIATAAMKGLLSNSGTIIPPGFSGSGVGCVIAPLAVGIADALIAELAKPIDIPSQT